MKSLTIAAMALSFSSCAPVVVYANDTAAKVHHSSQHIERAAIPNNATALFPTVTRDPDADGLSRNTENCNRGCIDN